MQDWISQFVFEADRIEEFFVSNLNQLIIEFKKLEQQYASQYEVDEQGNVRDPKYMQDIPVAPSGSINAENYDQYALILEETTNSASEPIGFQDLISGENPRITKGVR